MWYFQNLKESFLQLIRFRKHAQPFISGGLTGWFSYPVMFCMTLGVLIACLFGYDYYYRSPKKSALLNQGFGDFKNKD